MFLNSCSSAVGNFAALSDTGAPVSMEIFCASAVISSSRSPQFSVTRLPSRLTASTRHASTVRLPEV
jgi:hypothetical protein